MDTFLVRTLLVPSTVVLLGRWNWWPSRLHAVPLATADGSGPAREISADSTSGDDQPVPEPTPELS
jgi:uncharacterized membrane protein YdfJ with MMPL/SSD domain